MPGQLPSIGPQALKRTFPADDERRMLHIEHTQLPNDVRTSLTAQLAQEQDRAKRGWMRRGRSAAQDRVEQIESCLTDGTCIRVRVEHVEPPAVLTHEHGLLVLIPVDAMRTHMVEISSVADDARWELARTQQLMRRHWEWLRVGDLGPFAFRAHGDAITPLELGDLHGTELEELLLGNDDGWPGDDTTLDLAFAAAVELA